MSWSQVRYEVAGGIATLTLHRPDRLNAFTAEMAGELGEVCAQVDADDAVRVLVVTGAGRAFCAGADLGEGGGTFDRRDHAGDAGSIGGLPRD